MKTHVISMTVLVCATACTTPEPVCSVAGWPDVEDECRDAVIFAARESATIRVEDDDVDDALAFLAAVRSPACIPDGLQPFPRQGELLDASVVSSHVGIVDAWSAGRVRTGVAAIDAVFEENGAIEVAAWPGDRFNLTFAGPIAPPRLAEAAAEIPETTVDATPPDFLDQGDITRQGIEGGWTVLASSGWGDCLAGCAYMHYWTLFVSDDLTTVVVEEETGDPYPGVETGYTCLPPP